uniref:Uncharacterized protein n=1 Tax=uncultured prokaryote TaxID=198431 RepID=A0A0H5Q7X6_9ZZZZ|nr:hypothetical protein [uncultured prokaryote]
MLCASSLYLIIAALNRERCAVQAGGYFEFFLYYVTRHETIAADIAGS